MSASPSRRSFFRAAAGAAALPGFAASLAAASGDVARWQAVRKQFAFPESKVPMNAANLCPSPRAVAERVTELTADIDLDCSFQNRVKFAGLLEESRAKVAKQMRVSADEIALVRNTSEANNIVNNGVPLKSGDEVVLWDQNHPTNNVAWEVRGRRYGITVRKIATPAAPKNADELIDAFAKAIGPKTKLLTITHASNVSGIRLPAKEIIAMAKTRGLYVHVDGAQSWGALDVDLKDLGCDSYASSAHKWFCGPKEVGLLYVKSENVAKLWPVEVAPGWGDGPDTTLVGARKFESMGQRDDSALAAVGPTADVHAAIGYDAVERRMLDLATRLKDGLAEEGAKLSTPMDRNLSAGVVIMEVPAANRQKLLDALYTEHGIAGSTSGGLRLCPHIYNTEEHIDRAIAGVKKLRSLWA
jgi:selenocysteine lyase/cysteine desulfurase